MGGEAMAIDILIDKLTPCLEETATSKLLQTTFEIVNRKDLDCLKTQGWLFDWEEENRQADSLIYKLMLKGSTEIQGLLSAKIFKGLVYVSLAESAPHNRIDKQYSGVGGHLFAIAIKLSASLGFGGYVCMNAKNEKLVEHYQNKLNANRVYTRFHEYRMEISEDEAQRILAEYTMEGDLNVK